MSNDVDSTETRMSTCVDVEAYLGPSVRKHHLSKAQRRLPLDPLILVVHYDIRNSEIRHHLLCKNSARQSTRHGISISGVMHLWVIRSMGYESLDCIITVLELFKARIGSDLYTP